MGGEAALPVRAPRELPTAGGGRWPTGAGAMPPRRASTRGVSTALGHPRVHYRRTDSTNDRARALAIAGAPHGTLVTASEQTAGRGRQGRSWSAPPGSALLASLVLRSSPRLLPLIAAVAVCDVAGDEAMIKWPNDIVLVRPPGRPGAPDADRDADAAAGRNAGAGRDTAAGRDTDAAAGAGAGGGLAKLAGILAEGRPQDGWAVLGIGVNVAVRLEELPGELRDGAATLGEAPAQVEPTLARLLTALARRLAEPAQTVLDAYRARDALRGRELTWWAHGPEGRVGGRGRAEGIDGEGRLVVALAGGGGRAHAALDAGEVHLRV